MKPPKEASRAEPQTCIELSDVRAPIRHSEDAEVSRRRTRHTARLPATATTAAAVDGATTTRMRRSAAVQNIAGAKVPTAAAPPGWRRVRLQATRLKSICDCHDHDYPPWTGEIHGMSQALLSKSVPLRVFWWAVLLLCTSCGTATTILVVIEYLRGPTATSTVIRLVPRMELPSITVCPKVPDAFDFDAMFADMRAAIPSLTSETALDLVRFWLGGSGLQNMDDLTEFNNSYVDEMARLYAQWAKGRDPQTFFDLLHRQFGYKCADLFHYCELGGRPRDCCASLFRPRAVMRRGLCFQSRRGINQTEADDIGRLVLAMKAPASITSPIYNYIQPQIIIYVNDNFENILDFPRYYLYPHEWNRMHFSARLVELLEHPDDCTNKLVGKDSHCFVRNWMMANVVQRFNCTLPYLTPSIKRLPRVPTCEPAVIAREYYHTIQLVHSGSLTSVEKCIPGCTRWEYSMQLQQGPALAPFVGHVFNLEASFYDLQYENVKEVYTVSVPGFMSQIGGQFGFFLGLSIITMIQIAIYTVRAVAKILYRFLCKMCRKLYALGAFLIVFLARLIGFKHEFPQHVDSPTECAAERVSYDATVARRQRKKSANGGAENVAFAPTPPSSAPPCGTNASNAAAAANGASDARTSVTPVARPRSSSSALTAEARLTPTSPLGARISAAGAAAAVAYRNRAALTAAPSLALSHSPAATVAAWPVFQFTDALTSTLSASTLSPTTVNAEWSSTFDQKSTVSHSPR